MPTTSLTPPLDSDNLKHCAKCGQFLSVDAFCKDKKTRDGRNGYCRECRALINREYHNSHRDKILSQRREYGMSNRAVLTERAREYVANNRDKHTEYQRNYRKSDAGKTAYSAARHRRRAKKRQATGSCTAAELATIRLAQTDKRGRLRCWWCGKQINGTPHLDHKTALAKGGAHAPGNLCYSCAPCNLRKGAKTPGEFANRLL